MAQADGVVENGNGAAVRSDLNAQLLAVITNNSGATEPSTIRQYQFWYDTNGTGQLKIRNGSNNWEDVGSASGALVGSSTSKLEVTAGAAGAASIYPAGDTDSGFFFRQGSQASYGYGFSYSIAGTEWLSIDAQIAGDNSSPSWNWRSRNVSISSNVANDAGVQMTQSGRTVIQKDAGWVLGLNRTTNDGDIVLLAGQGTTEGTISVSGTTISYNGGHLSRWSQLPGGGSRVEILRGSVMSNTDEMCEWGSEDNEQLNRCKVSDTEGDIDVAGIFQGWDDGDETYTNDFYVAMTGDFVIRIAQGTTVARGDLLMSAGDGTAKSQTDDIVRSKTIAKVISTNVSTTYGDGSYCVPCVLMAC